MKCPFAIKQCPRCKRLLVANIKNFNKQKNGKYGLHAWCRKCQIKYDKERREIRKRIEENGNPFNNIDINKVWNHCPFVIQVCTMCERILVANENNFYKGRNEKLGLKTYCKKCAKKYDKKRYKNNKKEILDKCKERYENNKDKILKRCKQYREEHKEEIREYEKQWVKDNPNKLFNKYAKRKIKEENQGSGITKEQWYEMMTFFNWSCAYSGEYLGGDNKNRTIDHIVPLDKGGEHEVWNCVPMCKNYNCSKRASDMFEWYQQQPFFSEERLTKIYIWIEYAYNKWNK